MMRSRKRLRRHGVLVPKVFTQYAFRRVQVKAWVAGMTMNAYMRARQESPAELQRWLDENEIDPEAVGRRIFVSMMRQIFEENYYHGYWHPGNLLLLRGGWVAIVDFWAMGSLEARSAGSTPSSTRPSTTASTPRRPTSCSSVPGPAPTAEPEAIRDRIVNALRTFEVRTYTRGLPVRGEVLFLGDGQGAARRSAWPRCRRAGR